MISKKECIDKYELILASNGPKEFFISNKNGTVCVVGTSKRENIKITGWKSVQAKTLEEAKFHLADINIDIQELQNQVRVKTEHPDGMQGIQYQVNYEIEIPSEWSMSVENKNGDIRISGIKNNLKIKLHNGTVNASDIFSNVQVEIANGNIQINQTFPQNGLCLLKTINGSINLLLNKDASAIVNANVRTGVIFTESLHCKSQLNDPKGFQCTLNDGRGVIKLSTVNGQINIGYL
ncbi:MAG: hypothetical protein ABR936_07635 [Bacteroidota bacterium]|jgi:DUF4097 and DUF4098 domain-containing protein YvlB